MPCLSAADQFKRIPQTPEDAGSREAGSNFGEEGGGGVAFSVGKHLGEVYRREISVVMVTGNVGCGKNITVA